MNKKIILFDWDDTLFSKTEYKKRLSDSLAKICGISAEEAWKLEEEYFESLDKSGDFRIDNFLQFIIQKSGKKIYLTNFINDNLDIYSGSLFPESIDILNRLKNKFILGIYSQGFTDLQKVKIKSSGIKDFFDEKYIYINENKLDPKFIDTLPNGAIIIDDKEEVIKKLQSLNKFKLFWLNRKDNQKIDGVKTIKSLLEIAE